MSVCQIQVNSPTLFEGVSILPGIYPGEQHPSVSGDDREPTEVTYTMQLPAKSSGEGAAHTVQTLTITSLVRSGAVTVIT